MTTFVIRRPSSKCTLFLTPFTCSRYITHVQRFALGKCRELNAHGNFQLLLKKENNNFARKLMKASFCSAHLHLLKNIF